MHRRRGPLDSVASVLRGILMAVAWGSLQQRQCDVLDGPGKVFMCASANAVHLIRGIDAAVERNFLWRKLGGGSSTRAKLILTSHGQRNALLLFFEFRVVVLPTADVEPRSCESRAISCLARLRLNLPLVYQQHARIPRVEAPRRAWIRQAGR